MPKLTTGIILLVFSLMMIISGCTSGNTSVITNGTATPIGGQTTPAISSIITQSTPVTNAQTATSAPITSTQSASTAAPKKWSQPPPMAIDQSKTYIATVDTTLGGFQIKLLANKSPVTVNNFVFLAQQGFYNNVIFHRIIKTFMIQTGDPTGTGGGTPGYKFADELPPKHSYDPGIVAMANAGANTNGSQFFICTGADAKNLNSIPNYTQFGQVISGMDIVQKIAAVPVGPGNPGETSRPVNPPVITGISISTQ